MSDREEAYRAGTEARSGYVQRTTRWAHSGADAVTRLVDAAVYRYEREKHIGEPAETHGGGTESPPEESAESTEDDTAR